MNNMIQVRGGRMAMKTIIDACCGSKMFWYRKDHPGTVYMDIREFTDTLCDGRQLVVAPDVVGDFKDIPFQDGTFKLALFDPPHLLRAGESSWLAKKYGVLPADWKPEIRQGFRECMRVLEPHGILIMKWNEEQIPIAAVLKAIDAVPLFGDKRTKTRWMVFMKEACAGRR